MNTTPIAELLPLLSYSVLMSSTPGPNNVMLTASGANFGYGRTLPHILGLVVSHAPQIFLTCIGLGAIFQSHPALHEALRIAGAGYLMLLAWQLSRSAVRTAQVLRPMSFWQAAAFQWMNPKSWVKALTIASVFMPPALDVLPGAVLVATVSVVVAFPCISMWALFGVAIRRLLTDPRRRRIFNVIMAASLFILALTLIL